MGVENRDEGHASIVPTGRSDAKVAAWAAPRAPQFDSQAFVALVAFVLAKVRRNSISKRSDDVRSGYPQDRVSTRHLRMVVEVIPGPAGISANLPGK
jgi:hypothetical protein